MTSIVTRAWPMLTAAALLSGAALAAPPPPAQATFPPPCRLVKSLIKVGGQVVGMKPSECDDGTTAGPGVTLQRRIATGWTTVATGDDSAQYTCTTTTPRDYRVVQAKRQAYFAC